MALLSTHCLCMCLDSSCAPEKRTKVHHPLKTYRGGENFVLRPFNSVFLTIICLLLVLPGRATVVSVGTSASGSFVFPSVGASANPLRRDNRLDGHQRRVVERGSHTSTRHHVDFDRGVAGEAKVLGLALAVSELVPAAHNRANQTISEATEGNELGYPQRRNKNFLGQSGQRASSLSAREGGAVDHIAISTAVTLGAGHANSSQVPAAPLFSTLMLSNRASISQPQQPGPDGSGSIMPPIPGPNDDVVNTGSQGVADVAGRAASTFSALGPKPRGFQLIKRNSKCLGSVWDLGKKGSVEMCAMVVRGAGHKYFVYGTGMEAGACFSGASTESADCLEGLVDAPFDFYGLDDLAAINYLPMAVKGVPILVPTAPNSYLVVNSKLQSPAQGVAYRLTRNLTDATNRVAVYGSEVVGVPTGDGWLKVFVYRPGQRLGAITAEKEAMSFVVVIMGLALSAFFWEAVIDRLLRRNLRDEPELLEASMHVETEMVKLCFVATLGLVLSSMGTFNRLTAVIFGDAQLWHETIGGIMLPEAFVIFALYMLVLFLVMCQMILSTGYLCLRVLKRCKRWEQLERITPDVLLLASRNSDMAVPAHIIQYQLLRQEFIRPITNMNGAHIDMQAPDGFDFGRYLKLVTCRSVAAAIKVPPSSLLALAICIGPQLFCLMPGHERLPHVQLGHQLYLVVLSWLCFFAWMYLNSYLDRVYSQLLPPVSSLEYRVSSLLPEVTHIETPPDSELLAPYRELSEKTPQRSILCGLDCCASYWYGTQRPTQHEQLFTRWRKGPWTIMTAIQIVSAVQKVVLSGFALTLFVSGLSAQSAVCLPLLIVPQVLAALRMPDVICKYAMVTSVGDMVNHEVLEAVLNDRFVADLDQILAVASIAYTTYLHASCFKNGKSSASTPSEATSCVEQLVGEYTRVFDAWQQRMHMHAFLHCAPKGTLGIQNLDECLRILGIRCPRGAVDTWSVILDPKGTGGFGRKEFQAMLTGHVMATCGHLDETELLEMITELLGVGEHEQMTVRDIAELLDTLRVESSEGLQQAAKFLIMRARQAFPDGLPGSYGRPQIASVTPKELAAFLKRVGAVHGVC